MCIFKGARMCGLHLMIFTINQMTVSAAAVHFQLCVVMLCTFSCVEFGLRHQLQCPLQELTQKLHS